MEIDDPPVQSASAISSERIKAFKYLFGQHMCLNRLEWISIEDIEKVINSRSYVCFSRAEITILLEMMQSDNIVVVNN
nr:DNA replication licensing factor MCM3-like [Ziziphus jujuba var. spinosa]XP_048317855.1 DNA replication licensing factor MCM3-like [Ziziphus jujuba var. spinosa]XP_048317856.1 DNA replication licensing factor MCM3-like [Ziziphus jujuba var. spinosa]